MEDCGSLDGRQTIQTIQPHDRELQLLEQIVNIKGNTLTSAMTCSVIHSYWNMANRTLRKLQFHASSLQGSSCTRMPHAHMGIYCGVERVCPVETEVQTPGREREGGGILDNTNSNGDLYEHLLELKKVVFINLQLISATRYALI